MRTFLVSMFLISLLFLGIFIGINYADQGINQVQGQDEPSQGLHISTDEEGEVVSLSLLGKTFTNEEYQELQEESQAQADMEQQETGRPGEENPAVPVQGSLQEKEEPVNIYAELGASLGKVTQDVVRGVMEELIGWLDGFI